MNEFPAKKLQKVKQNKPKEITIIDQRQKGFAYSTE